MWHTEKSWIWTIITCSLDAVLLWSNAWIYTLSPDLPHRHNGKLIGIQWGLQWVRILCWCEHFSHHPWIWLFHFCPCSCQPGKAFHLWTWLHKTVKEGRRHSEDELVCYTTKLSTLYSHFTPCRFTKKEKSQKKPPLPAPNCNELEIFLRKLQHFLGLHNVTHLSSTLTWSPSHSQGDINVLRLLKHKTSIPSYLHWWNPCLSDLVTACSCKILGVKTSCTSLTQ